MKYYISDFHFGHARINDRIDHRGFKTVEDMDAYMIFKWNSRVKDEDEVFILGDLSISGDGETVNRLLKKMCGRKTLLIGNHDSYLADPLFREARRADHIVFGNRRQRAQSGAVPLSNHVLQWPVLQE